MEVYIPKFKQWYRIWNIDYREYPTTGKYVGITAQPVIDADDQSLVTDFPFDSMVVVRMASPKSTQWVPKNVQAQMVSQEDEAVKLIEDEQDKMKEDEVPEIDMDLAVGRRFPGMEDKVAAPTDRPAPKFNIGDIVTVSNRDPTHQFVITRLAWARQIDEWFYTLLPHKGGPNYSPHPVTGMLQSTQVPEYALTKIG